MLGHMSNYDLAIPSIQLLHARLKTSLSLTLRIFLYHTQSHSATPRWKRVIATYCRCKRPKSRKLYQFQNTCRQLYLPHQPKKKRAHFANDACVADTGSGPLQHARQLLPGANELAGGNTAVWRSMTCVLLVC